MSSKIFLIFLEIFCFIYAQQLKDDLLICPNEYDAKILVANVSLTYQEIFFHIHVKNIRLPENGTYKNRLTCIQIIDLTNDQSSGTVTVTDGGLEKNFIELRFESRLGGHLYYVVQAYTK